MSSRQGALQGTVTGARKTKAHFFFFLVCSLHKMHMSIVSRKEQSA